MQSRQLFNRTRFKLTIWYAGVMGVIFFLGELLLYCGFEAVQKQGFDRTIEDLAGTLHDYLQPQLAQPGHVQSEIRAILTGEGAHQMNLLGITRQRDYYIRLVDLKGQTLATSNFQPVGLPSREPGQRWQTLIATDGSRYRQINDYLHNRNGQTWGYLQLGRSLQELDFYRQQIHLILGLSVPVGMVLVGITGYWLAELAMRPIYRSYQQMEQFTADAAHELRTPLTTIRTLVQTTLSEVRGGKPIHSPKPLEAIERQNDRLVELVADLLLLSRTEHQGQLLVLKPCCLNDVMSDLQEELAAQALSAGVTLSINLANIPETYVLGNEELLYRLFTNLIANGIDYTPAGGMVTIYLKQTRSSVLVQVEDTGIGIAEMEQKNVFDRFYRIDAARSRHRGGSGLGLSICRAIAQVHHGNIQVQSQLGQGSIFTVTLPKFSPL
jgi:signal transduction histidine kinase